MKQAATATRRIQCSVVGDPISWARAISRSLIECASAALLEPGAAGADGRLDGEPPIGTPSDPYFLAGNR